MSDPNILNKPPKKTYKTVYIYIVPRTPKHRTLPISPSVAVLIRITTPSAQTPHPALPRRVPEHFYYIRFSAPSADQLLRLPS